MAGGPRPAARVRSALGGHREGSADARCDASGRPRPAGARRRRRVRGPRAPRPGCSRAADLPGRDHLHGCCRVGGRRRRALRSRRRLRVRAALSHPRRTARLARGRRRDGVPARAAAEHARLRAGRDSGLPPRAAGRRAGPRARRGGPLDPRAVERLRRRRADRRASRTSRSPGRCSPSCGPSKSRTVARQLVALGSIGVSASIRTQFLVLVPVLAATLLGATLLLPEGARPGVEEALAEATAVLAVGLVAVLALLAGGRSAADLLGSYGVLWGGTYDVGDLTGLVRRPPRPARRSTSRSCPPSSRPPSSRGGGGERGEAHAATLGSCPCSARGASA